MITIEVIGAPRLEEALRRLQSKLTSLKSPMGEIGELLTNIAELSFDNEQSPDGTPWHPLKESTKRYKAKHGGSKILQSKDSNMYESINSGADDHSVLVGVNAFSKEGYPYPLVHQFGKNARPFFPITKEGNLTSGVEEEIYSILEDYLKEFAD
ncbi:MAG: phage virion morphogenesis protein [Campylobacterales bacterium]|nr:phage virion morphogenesis protein [Campylobacterales bacterium]